MANDGKLWTARSPCGAAPIYSDPDDLWGACCEYFEWVEGNPLKEAQAFAYQGQVTVHELAKMRAMTVGGLCIFLGISHSTWVEYRKRSEFEVLAARVDDIIRTQKFEGAAAGLLNASIVGRDLGLADKTELTGRDGGPVQTKEVSDYHLARMIAFLMAKAAHEGPPKEDA